MCIQCLAVPRLKVSFLPVYFPYFLAPKGQFFGAILSSRGVHRPCRSPVVCPHSKGDSRLVTWGSLWRNLFLGVRVTTRPENSTDETRISMRFLSGNLLVLFWVFFFYTSAQTFLRTSLFANVYPYTINQSFAKGLRHLLVMLRIK